MTIFSFGVCTLTIKHTFARNGVTYYQRAVPNDLQERYGTKTVKQRLKSTTPLQIAREVTRINKEVEAEWQRLRSDSDTSPKSIRAKAQDLLQQYALSPRSGTSDNDELMESLFHDFIDDKRIAYADKQANREEAYDNASGSEFLTPVEIEAARLLAGTSKPRLTDAMDLYLKNSSRENNQKFVGDTKRSVEGFVIANGGDLELDEIRRAHIKKYEAMERDRGNSTGTTRRRINSLKAIYQHWFDEHEIDGRNPFTKFRIEGEGQDTKRRKALELSELAVLLAGVKVANDDLRWILAMLMDTGARLAEIVGLSLDDIRLESEVPHIIIQPRTWRSLKTPESERSVPLVGAALWAAEQVLTTKYKGQTYAFPRRISNNEVKADSASATLNKWMRTQGVDHTCHELRHTMTNRLKSAGCPEGMIKELLGWSRKKEMVNHYGSGYMLAQHRDYLLKTLEASIAR